MLKVVVGMSGGIDSTIAALKLKEQGCHVVGVYLRLWRNEDLESEEAGFVRHINRLKQAAQQIDVDFCVVDARESFRDRVVEYFVKGYTRGVTPNPCFFCNRHLKWTELLRVADEIGADFSASGHYASVVLDPGGVAHLHRGVDPKKDQSYVLAGLTQDQLRRIMLPLGAFTKDEVRKIAAEHQLIIAGSDESQDICFLPAGGYDDFIRSRKPSVVREGDIIDIETGNVVGRHAGLAFYTIGQRKGLGVYAKEPRYVLDKNVAKNQLVIGQAEALGRTNMAVREVNWIHQEPSFPLSAEIEVRYHSRAFPGILVPLDTERLNVQFSQPVRDVTPGQAAVFFKGTEVLGSGIIEPFETLGGSE